MPLLESGSHKQGFLSYTIKFYIFTYSYCKAIYENEFPLLLAYYHGYHTPTE